MLDLDTRFTTTIAAVSLLLLATANGRGDSASLASDSAPQFAVRVPWRLHSPWPAGRDAACSCQCKPHPAVARIVVPEGQATAYGTGTLIDVRDDYGLVVTNWHVVRDATDVIEVVFPDGFRSQARALKVDSDWDLAALVIWRPEAQPVALAVRAPRPGDPLTIHGYGQGQYRIARGRCTQFYAPRTDFPTEMVELDVEARQGDSGGPIFNAQGELAGVLFGAGQGTTIGSFGPRVENFLATLAPDIGRPAPPVARAAAPAVTDPFANTEIASRPTPTGAPLEPVRESLAASPRDDSAVWPTPGNDTWPSAPWSTDNGNTATNASNPWQQPVATATVSLPAVPQNAPAADGPSLAPPSTLLDQAKSLFALIGLFAVCMQIARVVT